MSDILQAECLLLHFGAVMIRNQASWVHRTVIWPSDFDLIAPFDFVERLIGF
ncbi:MAG: hypothetical protein ABJ327_06340 [Litoreibacter sp.]